MKQETLYIEKAVSHKITLCSFILAVVIVIRHSAVLVQTYHLPEDTFYAHFENAVYVISYFPVAVFFALSGFLFFRNYSRDNWGEKLKKRIHTLVIPYFFWNMMAYLYYAVLKLIPFTASHINQYVPPLTFANLLRYTFLEGFNVTWFLLFLIILTYISPILYFLVKNKNTAVICIAAFTISSFALQSRFLSACACYLTGAAGAVHFQKQVLGKYSHKLIACSDIFLIAAAVCRISFPVSAKVIYLIRPLLCIAVWVSMDRLRTEKELPWWTSLSFMIYVSHICVLASYQKLFLILFGSSTAEAWASLILVPALTVLTVILISSVVRKCRPLWNFISGGR